MGETFVDPGATATDPEDGALPVTADCAGVDTSRAGRYTCTYRATDSAGNTASASRIVIVTATTPVCATVSDSPANHIAAGRAVAGGFFNLRALSNADRQDIGFAWDTWSRVTLYEGEPGRWYARIPEACRK